MADRNRRLTLAAIALPVLFLVMSGLARAASIVVNTLDGGTESFSGPVQPDRRDRSGKRKWDGQELHRGERC